MEEIEVILKRFAQQDGIKSVLMIIADENHPAPEELNPVLAIFPKPIIGGVFPEIIVKGIRKKSGCLVIALPFKLETLLFNFDEPLDSSLHKLEALYSAELQVEKGSLFIFTDALGTNKNGLIEYLYNFFGFNVSYLGGGCGSLSFQQFNCIIHNSGMHSNSAVIGLSGIEMCIGVAHGWSPISETFKVTETEGTKLISIDWEPSFSLYKKVVEKHSNQTFSEDNFFEIAKSYPFGMVKMDDEMVIRDPIMVDGDKMIIVDEIKEGEYVRIMTGNMNSLLLGAEKASQIVRSSALPSDMIFCVDCISRVLYMGEDFDREIEIIQGEDEVYGALSIGEIANSGESFLEIYNKTVIVAKW
jgi:hypothetical protein